jgi:N-acetylglucosaminyldiphosphoundecaprenol N-acetyl-beta-D-mannosaminyltransferase
LRFGVCEVDLTQLFMENFNVFGMKVSNYCLKEIDELYDQAIHSQRNIILYGYSFGLVSMFKKYPDLYQIANSYDVLVCDGTIFNWYCKLFGFKLKTVMSVPDLTNYTLDYADKHNLKVLLFGATKEINLRANKSLEKKYPKIIFLEGIDGFYNDIEENKVVSKINELSPDLLLIGMSGPKKERFAKNNKEALCASIIIPCGGMIDVYAGKTKQSPKLIKKIGLASLFRIIQEPRRLLLLNLWMAYETLFKIIPLTIFYRIAIGKDFNFADKYLKIKH